MNDKDYDLIEQFTRVEWLFHRYHQKNHMHFGPMGDPRKGQGRVLAILKMKPEISQKDLSYLLDMRPQSLGELLTKLEKNGYITRTPSDTDRRVMIIKLTKEGEEASNATGQEFSFDKLFECLSEEEQRNLSVYLGRIIETIEAQLGDDPIAPDFDPRVRGNHPLEGFFGGHPDLGFGRGPQGREFHHHKDMEGNPEYGYFDPRMRMGHHSGRMPFHYYNGMSPKQEETDEN
ncbi:MAG: transcriptional regulator, MarR family [Herbinix sp.]|jgi:DNA-binding MarR family transcriptional regulator|nr:transcriptional regulator, MarR family [Herbinix sp.]